MSKRSTQLLKAMLSTLHYSGAGDLMAPLTRGDGVIFMLHHVKPGPKPDFDPNGILSVTPEFLESVFKQVQGAGYDFIAMDDVPARLKCGSKGRPFAAFTLDDGYRDNREYAYPLFKRYSIPFTMYVPSDFPDGLGDLWWLSLEEALRRLDDVSVNMRGEPRTFKLRSAAQKTEAFHTLYWWLRDIPELEARAAVASLASRAGFDGLDLCRKLIMSWDELRAMALDPLMSIGAHTNAHFALAKLSAEDAAREITGSIARIERESGKPCRHFSYPYGCEKSAGQREFDIVAKLNLATAVTTRKGLLHASETLNFAALPRLSLNGEFQEQRYLKVLMSGLPFAFWNAARRLSGQNITHQTTA